MEFLMVLLVFPAASFLFGIFGQLVIKKIYLVVGITFLIWTITAFTMFNSSFFTWVITYSALSFAGAGTVYLFRRYVEKQ